MTHHASGHAMPVEFTPADIDHLLETALAQGLPDVVNTLIDGPTATLTVADQAAVQEWARRLEEPVERHRGAPSVMFSRHGYEVRIVATTSTPWSEPPPDSRG
jgi:hypothetical protein